MITKNVYYYVYEITVYLQKKNRKEIQITGDRQVVLMDKFLLGNMERL